MTTPRSRAHSAYLRHSFIADATDPGVWLFVLNKSTLPASKMTTPGSRAHSAYPIHGFIADATDPDVWHFVFWAGVCIARKVR
jgi:hypothetical protein